MVRVVRVCIHSTNYPRWSIVQQLRAATSGWKYPLRPIVQNASATRSLLSKQGIISSISLKTDSFLGIDAQHLDQAFAVAVGIILFTHPLDFIHPVNRLLTPAVVGWFRACAASGAIVLLLSSIHMAVASRFQ
jgi:hypothetical protein